MFWIVKFHIAGGGMGGGKEKLIYKSNVKGTIHVAILFDFSLV